MLSLITSDDILRRYIPNVLVSVKGETSLFDKLNPHLLMAERWVSSTFCSSSVFEQIASAPDSDLLRIYASKVVVSHAFMQAVPSLDLVLTPNGFGIVSNSNIAPASKERVERLILSLEQERDAAIQLLLSALFQSIKSATDPSVYAEGASYISDSAPVPEVSPSGLSWLATPQCAFFSATLFPDLSICDQLGICEHRWQKYLELRPRLIEIENQLATDFISEEQFLVFRKVVLSLDSASMLMQAVIRVLRAEIVRILRSNTDSSPSPASHNLLHIVDIIKKNPDEFPQWHSSATASLFNPANFENKKADKGYWF